jgi:hypothetical protein
MKILANAQFRVSKLLHSRSSWKYTASTHLTYLLSAVCNIQLHFVSQCWRVPFVFCSQGAKYFCVLPRAMQNTRAAALRLLIFHLKDLVRVIKMHLHPALCQSKKIAPETSLARCCYRRSHVLRKKLFRSKIKKKNI